MNKAEQSQERVRKPNYTMRRIAVGALAVTAVLGISKGIDLGVSAYNTSDFERYGCEIGDETAVVGPGETVWKVAASPLAEELDTNVDVAMGILEEANPDITSLGNVTAGTTIHVPTCEK